MKAEEAKRLELARRHRARVLIATLIVCVVTVYFLCVSLGSVRIALADVWGSLFSGDDWGNRVIVRDIRAPRVLGAAIAGAALSLGGMAMQALFKNPMASPSVLGISSGASFGAAFYIAYGSAIVLSSWGTVASAFGMALMTLLLVYSLAYRRNGGVQTTMLLLAGMATSALFSGLTSMIEFFSDEDTVTSIVFWMLGSFDGCGWHDDLIMLVSSALGGVLIMANLRELNLLTAGESKARALGVNVRQVRLMLLLGSALLVAGTVSVCGVISFVGLIIPHIFRSLVGPEHKRLAPLCILGGAIFLMLVDTFARSAMPPYELPVGTVTSIIGAPFFLWILRSRKNEIWRG
ncbi:MAG: iron ABC transporter permease [Candidatus Methanomethylophilus sp.]|jgi:iron complex transport system permease protein|nr:iron ABC transporter permease [Methanomethylophilus sp.]MCI2074725.1 iron ABC transporter permease [Methanomethylophilus sp.]MCI2093389.1 iron ABC transporter permease [Methanomethylophilus sp.]